VLRGDRPSTITLDSGSPSFFAVASMMRMFAWCGISQSIALGFHRVGVERFARDFGQHLARRT
jgi:hypothetical protein